MHPALRVSVRPRRRHAGTRTARARDHLARGVVPRRVILDYLAGELHWGAGHAPEAYAVLNACRALIYLTDGMGTYPDSAPPYPVLWVLTPNHHEPPFGSTAVLNDIPRS